MNYDAGDGSANVTQERRRARGASRSRPLPVPEARCREVRTPKGRTVLIENTARGTNASAVLTGTLVSVMAIDVGQAAVLAYVDSLQAVDPAEIEFSRA